MTTETTGTSTSLKGPSLVVGDTFIVDGDYEPVRWWVRAWCWVRRRPVPRVHRLYVVADIVDTTITYRRP